MPKSSTYLPSADVLEGIYCASAIGKSNCNDLDLANCQFQL
jgi:hypothetical protein